MKHTGPRGRRSPVAEGLNLPIGEIVSRGSARASNRTSWTKVSRAEDLPQGAGFTPASEEYRSARSRSIQVRFARKRLRHFPVSRRKAAAEPTCPLRITRSAQSRVERVLFSKVFVEEPCDFLERLLRLGRVGVELILRVRDSLEDLQLRLHPRLAQLAMRAHGVAQE